MKRTSRAFFGVILIVLGVLMAGCGRGPLTLEKYFAQIKVGQSNATDVLNMLPEEGMLHTTSSVSVLRKTGFSREVGIVVFNQEDSLVKRTDYLQRRSELPYEKLGLVIQTIIPDEILDEPYESDMRKHAAILRYCHEAMISDVKPFTEDQQTESLMGLARTALGVGIIHLTNRPRESGELLKPKGFSFEHPTLNECRLILRQETDNIFTVIVRTRARIDPFVNW